MSPVNRAVTPEVVRRIAELARLRLAHAALPVWAEQLARIVSYIDQIAEIPEEAFEPPGEPFPTPFRPDSPRPGNGLSALERNAPRRFEGFGVVPRVVGGGE